LGGWGWFLPPNFPMHLFLGRQGWFLPPSFPMFFFHTSASPPIFGVSVLSFPPPLVLALTFVSPFPPLFATIALINCQVGPISYLGSKNGVQCDVPYPRCGALSCDVACFIINNIVRLFKLCLSSGFSYPLVHFLAPSPPPMAWAWALEVNPFGTFHLSFPWPCLYSQIPFVLQWEMQIAFYLPFDCFVCPLVALCLPFDCFV